MTDFLNKIVTIAMIFTMLVLAPLLISYKSDEMLAKRTILNDVSTFIDKAKDTASISQEDVNKLYTTCNSHGLAVNVTVKRLIRTEVSKNGTVTTVYYAIDSVNGLSAMNAGDVIKVTINEVGESTGRRLTYDILKIDEGPFGFSLAGTVG